MSITLEGKSVDATDGRTWSGLWRFTKEKKSFLSYTFKQSGNVVPRDLYDYVSFVNEPPSAITPVPPGRKSKDKTKAAKAKVNKVPRGRGRPPSISSLEGALSPAPAGGSTAEDGALTGTNDAPTDINNSNMELNEDNDENGHDNEDEEQAEGGEDNNNDSFDADADMDVDNDEEGRSEQGDENNEQSHVDGQVVASNEIDGSGSTADGASQSAAPPTGPQELGPDIILEVTHPLIGMWEGSFNVKIPTGEESIVERFFFYAVQGNTPTGGSSLASLIAGSDQLLFARPDGLHELPPDPLFPYALLPTTSTGAFGLSLGLGAGTNSTDPLVKVEDSAKVEADTTMTVESSSAASTAPSSSAPTTTAVGSDSTEAVVPSAITSGPTDSTGSSATANSVFSTDYVVLLGFGRNSFGRFSVSGIYDEKTGELRCEKKYMVTKFSAKRGRRSYAECAATAAASGIFLPLTGAAAPMVPPSTRQRLTPSGHHLEDFNVDPLGKRKRSIGGYALQNSGKLNKDFGDTYTPGKSSSKSGKGGGSSSSKENAQAQAAAALAAAVAAAGPNALVGNRNPDNDDPDTDYREAFMDCDTGEIYEGGWYYGLRHGKGVCVYSDGLMYEGSWVMGKEHGKGLLMTGDRQVIYTGDWLEGNMHGFGTYTFGNGDRYSGDWREGSRHGKGDYTFQNGCKYSGEWKDNRRSGRGMFVWTDGSYYSGDWELAQRHGRGKLELANGFVYDGMWSRNVIEGKGICKFPGGQEYEGTYKNGLREGRGTICFAEGAVYEGRFREDRFDGQGTLKVNQVVPGALPDEVMIPLQVQSDFWRIHLRAGFGNDPH